MAAPSPAAMAEPCGPPAPSSLADAQRHWYDARDAHHDAWKVCGVTAGDLGLTEGIIARGGQEYLLHNRPVRIGVGALGCLALHDVARKDPDKARSWAKVGLVVRGLAFLWNAKGLMQQPGRLLQERT